MRTVICYLVAVSILFSACTHTYSAGPYAKNPEILPQNLHPRLQGRNVTIFLLNGEKVVGRDVIVGTDSTYWSEPQTGVRRTFSNREIHKLTIANPLRGFFEGLFFGLPVSAVAVFVGLSLALGGRDSEAAGKAGVISIAALVGFPIGGAVLGKEKYVVNEVKGER